MNEPGPGHPAADRVTPEALVVEQSRAVVGLSTWLTDAAVTARESRRLLQVLTPPDSRITYPLELLFAASGGQWVVRDGSGFRDGFLGVPVGWNGARFAPVDGAVPEVEPMDPGRGSLEIQVTTLHPATAELQLGASTAAVTAVLTGAAPLGWGTAEPATQPWSTREVTEFCRDRAPDPTALVVVAGEPGRRAVGRLEVTPVTTGVLEEVRLAGPAAAAVAQDSIDELVEDLAGSARSMIVAVHPTRSEGTRPSRVSPPAVPYGVLIGPTVLAERGVDHAREAPATSVRVLGRRSNDPACWCRLDGGPTTSFERLDAVLRHFDLGAALR
ncbi:DUF6177 family protein [Pseudonocardia humida]|uniref:Uncharacterized protein n=1 Tax=Pseudonocardia humida TaxID=2800819 RepID=A0ABT1A639_9PSEU|nr:DUF6177 family protein [Pseudonocardia humida]MCO1658383.1 hypothetical protein [Pseudonocardia humida]